MFATESETYGNGVLHIANDRDLSGVNIEKGNVISDLERERGVDVAPTEFEQRASITISAKDARNILKDMGYDSPENIYSKGQISDVLRNTRRLTQEEINTFVQKATELSGNK